jgi:hypothetical protein
VADEDIQSHHIDGLINSVRLKVLCHSTGRLPHRYSLLIPVGGQSDLIALFKLMEKLRKAPELLMPF